MKSLEKKNLYLIIALLTISLSIVAINLTANAKDTSVTLEDPSVRILLDLRIQGTDIEGDYPQDHGDDGSILVLSYSHSVYTPVEASSGMLTGKRVHCPLRFTKAIDSSTPLLYKAMCTNEQVDDAIFRFFRYDPVAQLEVHYFTIHLETGKITTITSFGADATNPTETVSIVYSQITWTWEEEGIEFTDNWIEET